MGFEDLPQEVVEAAKKAFWAASAKL